MPIAMHVRFTPHHLLPPLERQVHEFFLFTLGEPFPAAACVAPKRGPAVDPLHPLSNRVIEITKRRKHVIGKEMNHPIRDDFHASFNMAFIAWTIGAGWDRG